MRCFGHKGIVKFAGCALIGLPFTFKLIWMYAGEFGWVLVRLLFFVVQCRRFRICYGECYVS